MGENIFVCSSSGGGYAVQYGLLALLSDAGIKPNICFGTSGGALALYLASAANWSSSEMIKIASELSDSLVFRSWMPTMLNFLPSVIAGYKRGSINDRSREAEDFFLRHFANIPTDVEIWTGTYNVNTSRAHFFLNRNTDLNFTKINFSQFACDLPSVVENVRELARTVIASISIPGLLPPVLIGKELHCDGGVLYASPLSVLYQILPPNSHITYISSSNMNIDDKLSLSLKSSDSLLNTIVGAVHTLTRGLSINDISLGMAAMNCMGKNTTNWSYTNVNPEKLQSIEIERKKHRASFLKLYPVNAEPLDILNFNGNDVKELMNEAYQHCDAELHLFD